MPLLHAAQSFAADAMGLLDVDVDLPTGLNDDVTVAIWASDPHVTVRGMLCYSYFHPYFHFHYILICPH